MEDRLVAFITDRNWPMVAAAAIWLFVRAMKSERIPIDIPARVRPWVAIGLGVASGAAEAFIAGQPLVEALVVGAGAGLMASGFHESFVESARRGHEPLSVRPPALLDAPRESRRPPPDDDLGGPKAPPSIVTLSILVLTFAGCAGLGCGGAAAKFEAVAHSARDVAVVAEACSFAAKEQAMAECKTDACKADVLRKYAPIADVLDAFNESWCAVEPGVEGCK